MRNSEAELQNSAFTPAQIEQLRGIVKEAVQSEFQEVGLRVDTSDHQEAAGSDLRFLRSLRHAVEGTASKVGGAIVLAITAGVIAIIMWGLNVWKGVL